jgi:hypothetical protein
VPSIVAGAKNIKKSQHALGLAGLQELIRRQLAAAAGRRHRPPSDNFIPILIG